MIRALARTLLILALTGAAALAGGRTYNPPARPTVVRGIGNGMQGVVLGVSGGGHLALVSRTRHVFNHDFCRYKVAFPTFYTAGGGTNQPIQDTDLPAALRYQFATEYPYVSGNTGIPAATPVAWSMQNPSNPTYAQYTGPGTGLGYVLSDWYYMPVCYKAGDFIGFHTVVQNSSGGGTNVLPYTNLQTNFVQRYESAQYYDTDQIAAGGVSATSFVATSGASPGSGAQDFVPAMLLIDYGTDEKVASLEGDSLCHGTDEGNAGPTGYGDVEGSAKRNKGWLERGFSENLNVGIALNNCRPTDGVKYKTVANANTYRLQLEALANPTDIVSADGQNDLLGVAAPTAWAASTGYTTFSVVTNGGNVYINTRSGQSASSGGPTGTTLGVSAADGTTSWEYFGPATNGNPGAAAIYAKLSQVHARYKEAVPGVKIVKAFFLPYTTSGGALTALSESGSTVTATGTFPVLPTVGSTIQIAGVTPSGYNGTFTVTSVTGNAGTAGATVSYTNPNTGLASATVTGTWSDLWATTGNQVPALGHGPSTSVVAALHQHYRAIPNDPVFGVSGYIQPGWVSTYLYDGTNANDTDIWAVSPTSNTATSGVVQALNDAGLHPNGAGYAAIGGSPLVFPSVSAVLP